MTEINVQYPPQGEVELRTVPYGRTVHYGWLVRRDRAEALKGIVRPYKSSDEIIELVVRRGDRMHIVSLSSNHLVIDRGFPREAVSLRNPLVPGFGS